MRTMLIAATLLAGCGDGVDELRYGEAVRYLGDPLGGWYNPDLAGCTLTMDIDDTHRQTIEILHLMGATDVQIARLFQRRIALDALFGGLIGFILAAIVLFVLGRRLSALGSELLGSTAISLEFGAVLLVLPLFGVLLAMLVARLTILRALGRML